MPGAAGILATDLPDLRASRERHATQRAPTRLAGGTAWTIIAQRRAQARWLRRKPRSDGAMGWMLGKGENDG
jgi:hypothetical protein